MGAGECRCCNCGRDKHKDRVGPCECGMCYGYFPQGAEFCDNPKCEGSECQRARQTEDPGHPSATRDGE